MRIFLSFLFISVITLGLNAQDLVSVDGNYLTENNTKANGTFVSHYDNGQKKTEYNFLDGKEHGPIVSYYQNGKLKEKGTYNYGIKTGKWISYSKKGTVTGVVNFDSKGERDGLWEIWDENHIKRAEMSYAKGKRTNTWKVWDENGKLQSEKTY